MAVDQKSLLEYHAAMSSAAAKLMKLKNDDYAGTGDVFANFTRSEKMGVCSTEKGFLVRMTDKLSRLSSFAEDQQFSCTDEQLEDTLIDMINYCVLLGCYVQSRWEV